MPKQTPERIIDRRRSGDGYYTPGPKRTPVAGPDGLLALEWIPQGEGSGLDADMVDGLHADAFALAGHLHDDRYSQLDHLHDDRYSQLDHLHDDRYSQRGHDHDERYAPLDHSHSGDDVILELRDLVDVDSGYVHGGALVYNGSTQLWESTVIYPITLDQITDVDLSVLTDGDYLSYDSASQKWKPVTPPDPGDVATDSIWNAKGDLAVGTANGAASRLGVGSNGQVLTADSTQAVGMKWATLPTAPTLYNPAFARNTVAGGNSEYYYIVHRCDNLYLNFQEVGATSELRIYYGSTLVYTSPATNGYHAVNVDLSNAGLTIGTPYRIEVKAVNDTVVLHYMTESDAAI